MTQLNYNLIPRSEIEARIAHLRENLKKQNFDGALIFSTTELYYYSGYGADGAIYIPTEGEPVHLIKRNSHLTQQFSQIKSIKMFG
ncbi:MAG: aminopeptidase P family N-terminal domain-containing protein, partial [Candidatus Hodarchaeales archaeon]